MAAAIPVIITIAATGASIYQQQSAAEDAAHAAKMEAEATQRYNTEMAAAQAAALTETAKAEADATLVAADRLKSTQKALIASGGIDVNAGSSMDIYAETTKLAAKDVATITSQAETQGNLLKLQAEGQNTLLSQAATDAASKAYADANAATTSTILGLAKSTTSNKDFMSMVKEWKWTS